MNSSCAARFGRSSDLPSPTEELRRLAGCSESGPGGPGTPAPVQQWLSALLNRDVDIAGGWHHELCGCEPAARKGRSRAVQWGSESNVKIASQKNWHHELRFAAHTLLYCSDAAQVLSWLPLPLPACVPAVQARWPSPSEGCSLPRARVRCKARATSRCALYSPEVGSLSILVHLAYVL